MGHVGLYHHGAHTATDVIIVSARQRRDEFYQLKQAAEAGDLKLVADLVKRGKVANKRCPKGCTVLFYTTLKAGEPPFRDRCIEVIRLLLPAMEPAAINAPGLCDNTPLHLAADLNLPELVELLLLHATADTLGAPDEDGCTPLILAARSGHLGVVKTLLRHMTADQIDYAAQGSNAVAWAEKDQHLAISDAIQQRRKAMSEPAKIPAAAPTAQAAPPPAVALV